MSTFPKEQPNTYYASTVQGSSAKDELNRLRLQDQLTTTSMGGVLPEQLDPMRFERVLDIGCGTGGWLFEVARTYPTVSQLIGVDINSRMVNHAREQAKALQVDDRIEFHQMDAMRSLEFPDEYFDLVNERFATSWLRTWDWPKFLHRCQRVTKPGGVIRVTETNILIESTSPAHMRLSELGIEAFYRSGHIFTAAGDGMTKELPRLLHHHGLLDVQMRAHELEYRGGTAEGQLFAENMKLASRTALPFLQKWIRLPDDYEETLQQTLSDMQQPDFVATMRLLTVWGTRSPDFSLMNALEASSR